MGPDSGAPSPNDLMLVTANLRDFAHYEGLEVESWKR